MHPKLQKFVDPLPIMETITPSQTYATYDYYEVRMEEVRRKLHRDLPATRLWGYDGQFPGPLFDIERGRPIKVKWDNNLPSRHILPVDQSIHNVANEPKVRTVTHLHGAESRPEDDGYPEAWYTRGFRHVGSFFEKKVYDYANEQRPATLWYHDHTMGLTRLNVYAGLVGMYIIRGKEEKALNLPDGDYEIPLLIADRSFNRDGSLFYPRQPEPSTPDMPDPSIQPFFNGETNVVNGKVWPYLDVEPRKYRFRLLNAANTRAYELFLDSGDPFYQIGSDGGLLQKTVRLDRLAIEPAERMDVIIDFTHLAGKTVLLKNDLGPDADPDDETGDVMQFRVNRPLSGLDTSRIPRYLSRIPTLKNKPITTIRQLKLTGTTDQYDRPVLLLDDKNWSDPVTEKPALGSTEMWSFINVTDFTHPMHIHLIQFQVLDRQPFDLDMYNRSGRIVFTAPPATPAANEQGWKDTVAAPSGEITRVLATFAPHTGRYVWHCHILEHEDYDMMRPMEVIQSRERN
ncbi:MAG TPA: multicopper oxidase [Bacillota bacterium]|nr:multicopper oxidase [Bacillota bacterium]